MGSWIMTKRRTKIDDNTHKEKNYLLSGVQPFSTSKSVTTTAFRWRSLNVTRRQSKYLMLPSRMDDGGRRASVKVRNCENVQKPKATTNWTWTVPKNRMKNFICCHCEKATIDWFAFVARTSSVAGGRCVGSQHNGQWSNQYSHSSSLADTHTHTSIVHIVWANLRTQ